MKKRADYLSAARGVFVPRGAFLLQSNAQTASDRPRIGFTVTKKVGNAVVRNRVRRRLKEAVRAISRDMFCPKRDYVFIGRLDALTIEFSALCGDMEAALKKVARGEAKKSRPRTVRR